MRTSALGAWCAVVVLALLTCGRAPAPRGHSDASPTPDGDVSSPAIGETVRELTGSPGSSGVLPVRVYYPATTAGRDAPAAGGVYPLIVFSHGYQQGYADYAYVWRALVPAGYVVALPDRLGSSATIVIDDYAEDIAFVLGELQRLGAAGDPVLGGRLASASALLGHSTGGGASLIAQASQRRRGATWQARTLVLLAPLGRTFGPITGTDPPAVARDVGVPVLTLAGGRDCICPAAIHARAIYESLGLGATKYLATATLGDHCGFSDASGPGRTRCELAEAGACLLAQGVTLAPSEQNTLAVDLLRPWLDRYLKANAGAGETFRTRLSDPRWTFEAHDVVASAGELPDLWLAPGGRAVAHIIPE